jgi:hypothetical protein
MAAEQIDGQHRYKSQKQRINDNGRGAWIKADDKAKSGKEFEKWQHDGNQVDKNPREKIISVNNFGKIFRSYNFMVTGIDKGESQNPARGQFDPAVVFYGLSPIIQRDTLALPSPGSRR